MIINGYLISERVKPTMNKLYIAALVALALPFATAQAAEVYELTLKNNQFSPKELTVPAGQKIKVTVRNLDSTPAEFESADLNREKVVAAGGQVSVYLGPLNAGTYAFFDDFHHETTTGTLIVK